MLNEAKGQTKNMLMNQNPLLALEEMSARKSLSIWSKRKKAFGVAFLLAMDDAVSLQVFKDSPVSQYTEVISHCKIIS